MFLGRKEVGPLPCRRLRLQEKMVKLYVSFVNNIASTIPGSIINKYLSNEKSINAVMWNKTAAKLRDAVPKYREKRKRL